MGIKVWHEMRESGLDMPGGLKSKDNNEIKLLHCLGQKVFVAGPGKAIGGQCSTVIQGDQI